MEKAAEVGTRSHTISSLMPTTNSSHIYQPRCTITCQHVALQTFTMPMTQCAKHQHADTKLPSVSPYDESKCDAMSIWQQEAQDMLYV